MVEGILMIIVCFQKVEPAVGEALALELAEHWNLPPWGLPQQLSAAVLVPLPIRA